MHEGGRLERRRRLHVGREALEVDPRVDDLDLAARGRQLVLELAAQIVGDRDHRRGARDDARRRVANARDRADVAHVAAVGRDDERPARRQRQRPRRHEEVRPRDVVRTGCADTSAELEEAELPAAARVEDRELDLVPAVAKRVLELRDERTEVGVRRPRVHLRRRAGSSMSGEAAIVLAPLHAENAADLADRAARAQRVAHRLEQVVGATRRVADALERG